MMYVQLKVLPNGHAFAALQAQNWDESLTNFLPNDTQLRIQYLSREYFSVTSRRKGIIV
jgi:hypothetical protein